MVSDILTPRDFQRPGLDRVQRVRQIGKRVRRGCGAATDANHADAVRAVRRGTFARRKLPLRALATLTIRDVQDRSLPSMTDIDRAARRCKRGETDPGWIERGRADPYDFRAGQQ